MFRKAGFMNMHNVLSLETIAPKVTGAEQAWGAELINNPPPARPPAGRFWKVKGTSWVPVMFFQCWPDSQSFSPTFVKITNRAQK